MPAYAKVDKDYINNDGIIPSRVGKSWGSDQSKVNPNWPKVRFRLLDDDEEIYYGGWLMDDPYGDNQITLLQWGAADAGCTIIEVKRFDPEVWDEVWVREVG